MSIVSSSFLFLFLPLSVLLYYLIPAGKKLFYRNLFLVLISLFFYAWGEPYYVFLLLLLMVFVHIAGKVIDRKRNTVTAKIVVGITALVCVGAILFFRNPGRYFSLIGKLLPCEIPSRETGSPLGISFFLFFAVSYVVDIYRGKCHAPRNFLYTALYLSAFFKVTEGPIISYHPFEEQMENRRADRDMLYRGAKRFLFGLVKKVLIASCLSGIAVWIWPEGGENTVVNAWLGVVTSLVSLYIDFSAYTDMACGMALLFGFRLPENFHYPYLAHSVTEYWQRWHMTLIQWFKDYLYYPITLGPSVRFRRFLLRHGVKKETAKTWQNIFVPACVWLPTALWHGGNLNYLLWGILNCAVCLLEMKRKPSGRAESKNPVGWLYTILFLLLLVPLLLFDNIGSSVTYYGLMFGLRHNAFIDSTTWFILKEYGIFLVAGLFLCFPAGEKLTAWLRHRLGERATEIIGDVVLLFLSVIALAYVVKTGSSFFIYQIY